MEAVFSSETLVWTYRSKQHYKPEDEHRNLQRHENLILFRYTTNILHIFKFSIHNNFYTLYG
jgi:hypothetical protein